MPLRQQLYVMDCPSAGLYKLGLSWAPQQRVVDIKRAVGCPVHVLAAFDVANARAEELALHRLFWRQRRRLGRGDGCTEWFELSALDVLSILLAYSDRGMVWLDNWGRFTGELQAFTEAFTRQLAEALAPPRLLPIWLTSAQAVAALGQHRRVLNCAIREGKVRRIGRGRAWRVYRDDVLKLEESLRPKGSSH